MPDDGKKSTTEQFGEDISKQFKIDGKALKDSSDALAQYSDQINKIFTQGRQRITELSTALADATPDVRRLGGDIGNVADIIGKVADESRRNVVATTEEVEKLFAASKVLELGADTLTKAFLDTGKGIETIPKTLEESVQYIQSIGGNAKSVMQDVTRNMDQMNRYQFEGGVLGLTKMAAQASMLRFDMRETFQLADKVLSPEGAIETAAAFQRLGASVGVLADPFALMNASINDPGALQDSLVDVAKQFTYFDEKTKTFKINPQGVLTLKELQSQTGVSAAEMSKLGLAAAEADKRLSTLNSAGVNIKEDDKQYLANIAKMGDGGEYEVKLKNAAGEEQTRKLSEITQTEFEKLIKEQRDVPKTMEDIARAQMSTSELIMGDVGAIRAKIVGGVVSAGQVLQTREDVRGAATAVTGGLSKMGETKDVRDETQRVLRDLDTLFKDLKKDDGKKATDKFSEYLMKAGTQLDNMESKFKKSLGETADNISKNMRDKTAVQSFLKEGYDALVGVVKTDAVAEKKPSSQPISSFIEGKQSQVTQSTNAVSNPVQSNAKVDVGGKIQVEFTTTNGTELTKKMLDDWANSPETKQLFAKASMTQNPTKQPI